jgi:orotate phosphoribosyltransferase
MVFDKVRLQQLVESRCLIMNSDMKLSAGGSSSFYFDCKAITLHGEGLSLIARGILEKLKDEKIEVDAIGGLTMGADFIAAAVSLMAFQQGLSIQGSIVRKEPKKHGTKNRIENQLSVGTKIVVVDDVITSGASTEQACQELLAAGYKIEAIAAVIDRQAGGVERLRDLYRVPVFSLLKKSDFQQLG